MTLNDKQLKALIRKIQKEAGTAPSSNKKTTYKDDTVVRSEEPEDDSAFREMKKLPYSE